MLATVGRIPLGNWSPDQTWQICFYGDLPFHQCNIKMYGNTILQIHCIALQCAFSVELFLTWTWNPLLHVFSISQLFVFHTSILAICSQTCTWSHRAVDVRSIPLNFCYHVSNQMAIQLLYQATQWLSSTTRTSVTQSNE